MTGPDPRVVRIIDHLRGTALSIEQACADLGLDYESVVDDAANDDIANAIFNCVGCGWWCDNDDLHSEDGEEYCVECIIEHRGGDDA